MFERYTEKARRVIFFARYEASQFGSPYIETEHLLLGDTPGRHGHRQTFVAALLSPSKLFASGSRNKRPRGKRFPLLVDLPLSEGCKRVLAYAAEEAERLADKHIGTNHLLLGLVQEKDGLAAKVLSEAGFNPSEFRDEIGRMSDASWKVARTQKARLERLRRNPWRVVGR